MKKKKRAPQSRKPKTGSEERTVNEERRVVRDTRAAPETKRSIVQKKHRTAERRDTMATSSESKSAEQVGGSISQEVEREAKGISSWSSPRAGDAGRAAASGAVEGAGPLPPAAPQGGVDAVMSAIMAMSDLGGLKKATEETAASAESAVQSALAASGGTDVDVAKVVGVRSE